VKFWREGYDITRKKKTDSKKPNSCTQQLGHKDKPPQTFIENLGGKIQN
jgi:hypothetical protein